MTQAAAMTVPEVGTAAVVEYVFTAARTDAKETLAIAENLLGANLTSYDNHGDVHVPRQLMRVPVGRWPKICMTSE